LDCAGKSVATTALFLRRWVLEQIERQLMRERPRSVGKQSGVALRLPPQSKKTRRQVRKAVKIWLREKAPWIFRHRLMAFRHCERILRPALEDGANQLCRTFVLALLSFIKIYET